MFKVCVIEDEIIIRRGLIDSIDWTVLQCEVVGEASNGAEGYKLIGRIKPDIIILDINMPVMDGIEMLSHLPSYLYSVIIVSGHSEFQYAKKAIEYGVSEYLLKPVDHEELIAAILRAKEDLVMKRAYMRSKEELSYEKFVALEQHRPVDSITLNLALDYISEHFHEKISMLDLTRITGKSSTSINKRFQKELNTSFSDYLTRFRMQQAIELIKTLEYHLYEVAEMTGYSDYKYFNQVFKRTLKVSPKIVETYFLRMKQ